MAWDDLPPTAAELGSSSSSSADWASTAPTVEEMASLQSKEEPGQTESGLRGIGQGATMGFGDEAAAGTGAAIQKLMEGLGIQPESKASLSDVYNNLLNIERMKNKSAQEANPFTYGAGNIAGAVGTGLVAGGTGVLGKGLGLAGKTDAAAALTAAASEGSLGGLTAIGATEGAIGGLGYSEADNLKDAAIDTTIGAGIGALAPGALHYGGKLVKGTVGLAGKAINSFPIIGDVTEHLGEVYQAGKENLGKTFKGAAGEALEGLGKSADDLKTQGLAQESKYADDLLKGKKAATEALDSSSGKVRENLHQTMNQIGEDLQSKDKQISDFIRSNPSALEISLDKHGNIIKGDFNFSSLDDKFKFAMNNLDKQAKALPEIQSAIKAGDYEVVAGKLRDLNLMMERADPYERKILGSLKADIQKIVDDKLKNLPGEGGQLYGERMGIAKNYSQLADVRDGLIAGPKDGNAQLATNLSLTSNKENLIGRDLERELNKVKTAGNQNLNVAADGALQDAEIYNKFNVFNPEKGKMFDALTPSGENEQLSQQFNEVFGKPKDFGVSSSFAKATQELNQPAESITSGSKKAELLDWIRKTYGKDADRVIKELQDRAGKFQTLKAGLQSNVEAGQDVSSYIRLMKKAADPLAFMSGKASGHISNVAGTIAEKTGLNQLNRATTLRALTQPQNYKNTVEQFKQSQQNNEVVPENK